MLFLFISIITCVCTMLICLGYFNQNRLLTPFIFIVSELYLKILFGLNLVDFESVPAVIVELVLINIIIYLVALYIFYNTGFYGIKILTSQNVKSSIPQRLQGLSKHRFKNVFLLLLMIFLTIGTFSGVFIYGKYSLFEWLANIRVSYQSGRDGVGLFYAGYIFGINVSLIFLLHAYVNKKIKTAEFIIFFMVLFIMAYTTGSKRVIVAMVLFSLIVYDYRVKKLSIKLLLTAALGMCVLFVSYFLLSGSHIDGLFIYFNYLSVLFQLTEKIYTGQVGFFDGEIYASRIWEFIPRLFYPDKPYVYAGGGYITETLYPGAVQRGHHVGSLDFTALYLDFGFLGTAFYALQKGLYIGVISALFSNKTTSLWAMLLFLSLFSPVMNFAPTIMFIVSVYFINKFINLYFRIKL